MLTCYIANWYFPFFLTFLSSSTSIGDLLKINHVLFLFFLKMILFIQQYQFAMYCHNSMTLHIRQMPRKRFRKQIRTSFFFQLDQHVDSRNTHFISESIKCQGLNIQGSGWWGSLTPILTSKARHNEYKTSGKEIFVL